MLTSKFHHLQQKKHDLLQKHYHQVRDALAAARKALPEGPEKEQVNEALKAITLS